MHRVVYTTIAHDNFVYFPHMQLSLFEQVRLQYVGCSNTEDTTQVNVLVYYIYLCILNISHPQRRIQFLRFASYTYLLVELTE